MQLRYKGWYPDFDPTTPDTLVDPTDNLIPTNRGYRGFNDFSPLIGQSSISATATGIWFARRVTLANRMLVATATQVYERSGGGWSAMVGASITVSSVDRWQFAQVGDITLAGALATQPLQFESLSASTIAMPRYACIDTVGEFVIIGNVETSVTFSGGGINTVLPGSHPDRWWSSALGDYTSWTPSLATQATSNRLLDVAGAITCVRKLGERVAMYKQRGIWIGDYVGPPFIWSIQLISNEVGTFGQNCIVPVNHQHFFVGNDNFYHFDGAQVRPIGEGVREWFFDRLSNLYAHLIIGVQDQYNSLVLWWYPSTNSQNGTLDECIVYNYETGRWGRGTTTIQVATSFPTDEITYDELWVGLTFDTTPDTPFDQVARTAESFVPVVIDGDKRLSTLFGTHLDGTLRSNWVGDDIRTSLLRRVRQRWIRAPQSAELIPYRLMVQGDAEQSGVTRTMESQARFDFVQSARWHAWQVETVGNWESPGADAELVNRGKE